MRIRGQLSRAGASVGANYRAAARHRSTADLISKMGIVLVSHSIFPTPHSALVITGVPDCMASMTMRPKPS